MGKIVGAYRIRTIGEYDYMITHYKQKWLTGLSILQEQPLYIQIWDDGDFTWGRNNDEGVPELPVYSFNEYLKQVER